MPGAQFKAVYVPSFGSQSSRCSQKDGQQTKKYLIELSCSQRRHDALSTKNKIKLTKCKPALFKKKRKEERRSMPPRRPMIDRLTAVRSQGGGERSQHQKRGSPDVGQKSSFLPCSSMSNTGTAQSMMSEDIFTFYQRDKHTSTNQTQWAARQAVLRTIGRMLQENRSIRERLVSLSQSSQILTVVVGKEEF
ncbi:hypothetical protein J4Q44_G00389710 [Coregonus suidteri]|uniref:Uncharacterized protein n=1 Tax=Coregonus suidteri TaxID=861788 RepID=A0AAN8Q8W2_9TELE